MTNNILDMCSLLNSDWKFKKTIVENISLDTLIEFWINNYNFKDEFKDCKIKSWDYGINIKDNKLVLCFNLYEPIKEF